MGNIRNRNHEKISVDPGEAVYIQFGFKTIHVKWNFVLIICIPNIQSFKMKPVIIYGEP